MAVQVLTFADLGNRDIATASNHTCGTQVYLWAQAFKG